MSEAPRWPSGLRFVKGHGTENDFVLVSDPDAELDLSPEQVAAICDRRAGVGADGLIRAVHSAAIGVHDGSQWFMDYRNADGSLAEMCGNGVRVYTEFLRTEALIDLPVGSMVLIGTRGGAREVRRVADGYAADMGAWRLPGGAKATVAGELTVGLPGWGTPRPALGVEVPNPHAVVALSDPAELDTLDLSGQPLVHPTPPDGVNVEFVAVVGEQVVDGRTVCTIRMRVHERGVGETRSCGTGACAAAIAVHQWGGPTAPTEYVVEVPGGRLQVRLHAENRVELAGPAALTAAGQLLAEEPGPAAPARPAGF